MLLVVLCVSVRQFVIAGRAAGFAVKQAVDAEAYVQLRLAQDAEFFAPATRLRLFALSADDAAYTRLRGHGWSVARLGQRRNVTEVTGADRRS